MHAEEKIFIEIGNLYRSFKNTAAIAGVNLTIEQGELFGIVGPDGAGKTTLLRMMAGVLSPSAGFIRVGEWDTVQQAEAIKAQIGYMPQQFGLYGDLTVDENLNFVADVYGVRGDHRLERLAELYNFTGLERFNARRAHQLSGGMKKKLALACALVHRPKLLLLDEPTTGVDPVARRNFWDLLSSLHAQGTTTVVSTPYMDEAERCNRVLLLYAGQVLACDTPENIKSHIPGKVLALNCNDKFAAEIRLRDLPGLISLQTYGDQLNIIVAGDLEVARHTIQERLANLSIERLEPATLRMEEAFIYLVSQARKDAA